MKLLNRLEFFVLFACFLTSFASAQLPVFNDADVTALADDKKAIIIERTENVRIDFNKGKPEITLEFTEFIMHLSDNTAAGNEIEIPYSDKFFSLKSLQAATWIPSQSGYKRIKTEPAKHSSSISPDYFYDDMMQAKVVFPSIQNKAITEIKYTYLIKDPIFAFPYYFKPGSSIPMMKSKFYISFPENCNVEIRMFGDTAGIVGKNGDDNGRKWFEKSITSIKSEKTHDYAASQAYFKPHLFYILHSYSLKNGEQVNVLGNVNDLYKNNYQYIKDLNNTSCSSELIHVTDSLRGDLKMADSLVIIEKLYYWIQDHIRYVAFEDGLGGFVPRPSNSVFTKRYGDCKDKAALMQFMLKHCGIQSNLVWIGTRSIPYSYQQLPLMQSSNHMILAKQINNEWMFFDPTAENLQMGFPSSFIQGKEAMIAQDETHFEIVEVPIMKAQDNYISDSLKVKFTDVHDLNITGDMEFGGYARWRFMSSYKGLNETDKKKLVDGLLKHNNNKAEIIKYTISGTEDRTSPIKISYEIVFPDYINKIDDKLYMNLNIHKPMMNEQIKEIDRTSPAEYLFKYSNKLHLNLYLPKGFTALDMPKDNDYSSDLISYKRETSTLENVISFNSNVEVNTILLRKEQFQNWNTAIGTLNKQFKESITLIQNKNK